MRKRVYVIYTGGTLGMQKTERGFVPAAGFLASALQDMALLHSPEMPEFMLEEYAPLLDSSDMQPSDWSRIATSIHQHYDDYDGFVVLHGTDTMAYSAAAVSHLLAPVTKSIVFTGAQIPLSEPDSDAPLNIRNALYAAAYSDIAHVGILFHRHLLLGAYATKVDAQHLNAFASPNADPLLEWEGEYLQLPHSAVDKKLLLGRPVLQPLGKHQIAVVTMYPGMNTTWLADYLAQPWDGILLQTFGSGNAPQDKALLRALRKAVTRGAIIVNRTQCPKGRVNMDGYAGGSALSKCGVLPAGDMTLENTLVTLHVLLSQPDSRARALAAARERFAPRFDFI